MAESAPLQQRVTQHYSQATGGDLLAAVLAALTAAGTDVSGALRYEDLGGLDHFHGGALTATRELAQLGELARGERVLDMGGGFGGPARTLAAEYGCQVTVLDPTESFIQAGRALTERLGLRDSVAFYLGSGLAMPFGDERFDVVWTQNASMNIPDKAGLVAEQRRVLRHGGRLVFQEIFAGPGGDLVCPVPWARDPATSFLVPPEQVRTLLREAGFEERSWLPLVPDERASGAGASSVRSAVAVVHGSDAAAMEASSRRNQAEQRVIYLRAVFVRR
jgi:ubiquinone/menaquinone biosynthesis C-methylase UbiE